MKESEKNKIEEINKHSINYIKKMLRFFFAIFAIVFLIIGTFLFSINEMFSIICFCLAGFYALLLILISVIPFKFNYNKTEKLMRKTGAMNILAMTSRIEELEDRVDELNKKIEELENKVKFYL